MKLPPVSSTGRYPPTTRRAHEARDPGLAVVGQGEVTYTYGMRAFVLTTLAWLFIGCAPPKTPIAELPPAEEMPAMTGRLSLAADDAPDFVAIKADLLAQMEAGTASQSALRLLVAICSASRDLPCRNNAYATWKSNRTAE
jgi:hypothetical protein